jgi:hypothetical protein
MLGRMFLISCFLNYFIFLEKIFSLGRKENSGFSFSRARNGSQLLTHDFPWLFSRSAAALLSSSFSGTNTSRLARKAMTAWSGVGLRL